MGMGTSSVGQQSPSSEEATQVKRRELKGRQLVGGITMFVVPVIGGIGWTIVSLLSFKVLLVVISLILYSSVAWYLIAKGKN